MADFYDTPLYVPSSNITGGIYVGFYMLNNATNGGTMIGSSGCALATQTKK